MNKDTSNVFSYKYDSDSFLSSFPSSTADKKEERARQDDKTSIEISLLNRLFFVVLTTTKYYVVNFIAFNAELP